MTAKLLFEGVWNKNQNFCLQIIWRKTRGVNQRVLEGVA